MSSGWGFPEELWELGSQISLKADRSRLLCSQTALKILAIIPAPSVTCPSEIPVLHEGLHPTPQLDNSNDKHLQQSSWSPLLALVEKSAVYPFAQNSICLSVFCESCSWPFSHRSRGSGSQPEATEIGAGASRDTSASRLLSCHRALYSSSLLPNENCPTSTALEESNSKS